MLLHRHVKMLKSATAVRSKLSCASQTRMTRFLGSCKTNVPSKSREGVGCGRGVDALPIRASMLSRRRQKSSNQRTRPRDSSYAILVDRSGAQWAQMKKGRVVWVDASV